MGCGGSKNDAAVKTIAVDGSTLPTAPCTPEQPLPSKSPTVGVVVVVATMEAEKQPPEMSPEQKGGRNEQQSSINGEFPEDPLYGRTFVIDEESKDVDLQKGITYRGGWVNGKQHGIGERKYPDGSYYIGEFYEGKPHGMGIFTAKDGSHYRGPFKDGKAHGYGVFTFKDGTKYYGQYFEDRREGRGREVQPDNLEYIGEYMKNTKHGKGVLKAPNGETFEGDFANGEIEGYGKYCWPDGRVYVGWWEKSKQNGVGEFHWPDGRHFKGQYKDGKINGEGCISWNDGRKYDGQWKNGLQNGRGKYWATPNEYREAQFLDGVRVKWLGDPVIVKEQPEEVPIVPTAVDTSEVPAVDRGIDKFLG